MDDVAMARCRFWRSRLLRLLSPPARRGRCALQTKCHATLEQGAAGEVRHASVFDLPRHAEAEVALYLIDRRGAPSSKEGREPSPTIRA